MLIEAILSVVIVSVCLTLIAQSLLTNFRTGMRFQEMVRSFIVMENRLGLLYATKASSEDFGSSAHILAKPFDKFTATERIDTVSEHLKKVELKLNWPAGKNPGLLEMTTLIYNPDET